MEEPNNRKKNRWILFALALFIVGGFVGLLLISSSRGVAMEELKKCKNEIEVKHVWDTYRAEQLNDNEFVLEVRNQLASFNLSQKKVDACLTWLPESEKHVNIIVVPDLSERITNTEQFPGQKDRDTEILRSIWKEFINLTGKRETKNQLIFALTDGNRMNGPVQEKIDNLFICMDDEENTPEHYFFTSYRTTKFNKNSRELYELANQNPIKADFFTFLKSNLQNYLKHSTLFESYVNKLIILTDGSINQDTGGGTTEIANFENQFSLSSNKDSILKCITNNGLNLRPVSINWSNTEVMICEINGSSDNKAFYTEVLSVYWKDWFNKMGCPVEINSSSLPPKLVCISIRDFLRK